MGTYGYIRVSSTDQCEDRQRIALQEVGVPNANIYLYKQSGRDFNNSVMEEARIFRDRNYPMDMVSGA